jgi:hypothetical protein
MKCVNCPETDLAVCMDCYIKGIGSEFRLNNHFELTALEVKALVKEFATSYINANENHLAALTMQRMIGFVNELAKDNT